MNLGDIIRSKDVLTHEHLVAFAEYPTYGPDTPSGHHAPISVAYLTRYARNWLITLDEAELALSGTNNA